MAKRKTFIVYGQSANSHQGKGILSKTMIRPVVIYGVEAWTKSEEGLLERPEMRRCGESLESPWILGKLGAWLKDKKE